MQQVAPWVRVVIVTHNSGAHLERCLQALRGQNFANFEAVIVDNASTDGSIDALRLADERFSLQRALTNLGFAAANNLGAKGSDAAWIATLNPDTEPHARWLEELHQASVRHPWAGMFGSTQLDAGDPERVDGFGDVYSIFGTAWRGASGASVRELPSGDREVLAPCAAAALYARAPFEAAGGFDESFFCYLEDVDLGFRLRLRGMRCVQVRKAEVKHVGGASAGRASEFFVFHSQRNRIWVMIKNLPSPLLWLTLLLQLGVVPLVILRRGPRRWSAAIKGVAAACVALPHVIRARRKVQSERVVDSATVARCLVFDPRKALRHAPCFMAQAAAELR